MNSPRLTSSVRLSLTGIADFPDRVGTIVAHQQGAIGSDGDAHRPPPNTAVRQHEAGDEILVFAAGVTGLMQGHANDFISRAHRPVPRAVLGGENVLST